MDENEQVQASCQVLKVMFFITLFICIPPLVIYGWARFTGALPSEAEWIHRGGNHGPWWDQPQGIIIGLAWLVIITLPFITFLISIALSLSIEKQRLLTLAKGVALAIFQFAIGWFLFLPMLWAVD